MGQQANVLEESREGAYPLPLGGVRVLELAQGVAGPFCARLLADMGAEVVKIEPPGTGDPSRRCGPFPDDTPDPERSGLFAYLNVNKRGITLDLPSPTGKKVFLKLARRTDVLVETSPPGYMDGPGLDAPRLRRLDPALIVLSITPFGLTGPRRLYKTADLVTYNVGGFANGTPGFPDFARDREAEPPLKPDAPIAGLLVGSVAAAACLSALLARDASGRGCHLDISEQEAVAGLVARELLGPSYAGLLTDRAFQFTANVPNIYLPCKDGYVSIVAYSQDHFARFRAVMGDPPWARDEKFATPEGRVQNWPELKARIQKWATIRTQREIVEQTMKSRLPCFAPFTVAQMAESEHVQARGSLVEAEMAGGRLRMPGPPVHWAEAREYIRRPAPRLGEHTAEVLAELGLSGQDVLRRKGTGAN